MRWMLKRDTHKIDMIYAVVKGVIIEKTYETTQRILFFLNYVNFNYCFNLTI
jgi:hypothetical protein